MPNMKMVIVSFNFQMCFILDKHYILLFIIYVSIQIIHVEISSLRIINDNYFGESTKEVGKLGQIKSKKALDALLDCIDSPVIKNKLNGEGYAVIRWLVIAMAGYIGELDGYKKADIYNKL